MRRMRLSKRQENEEKRPSWQEAAKERSFRRSDWQQREEIRRRRAVAEVDEEKIAREEKQRISQRTY